MAYIPAPPAALAPSGERLDPSLDDAASDWLKFKLQQQSRTLAREISEIKRRWTANFAPSNLRFPRRADQRFRADLPEKRWTQINRVAGEGI